MSLSLSQLTNHRQFVSVRHGTRSSRAGASVWSGVIAAVIALIAARLSVTAVQAVEEAPSRAALQKGMGNPRQLQLKSFSGHPSPGGRMIQWETRLEWGVAGFELERNDAGNWTSVGEGLVAASNRLSGGKYEILDSTALPGQPSSYRLTARLTSGDRIDLIERQLSFEGAELQPTVPLRALDSKSAQPSVSKVSARHLGLQAVTTPVDLTTSTSGVRILTTAQGMHFLSSATLANLLGQSSSSVVTGWINSGKIALYCGGFDAAHQVTFIPGNGYTSGGTTPGLFFYAQTVWNNYTTTNAYWLRAGTNSYTTVSVGSPTPVTPGSYTALWSAESDQLTALSLISQNPGTPQGLDTDQSFWFWSLLTANSGGSTWTTTFALDHLSKTGGVTATLTLNLFGATATAQKVTVSLNGTVLDSYAPAGSLAWTGTGARQVSITFPMTLLNDNTASPSQGKNTLKVQALLPSGVTVSQVYVDSYKLTYRRNYAVPSAFSQALEAAADSSATPTVTISGFSGSSAPSLVGFDVTDPLHPQKVTGITVGGSANAWTASLKPSPTSSRYAVLNAASSGAQVIPASASLSLVAPPQLDDPSIRASYVIVSHSSLTNSANALATYRSGQFRTKVVVIDDIYNQFGFGVASPQALQSFVATAYSNWAIRPRYLVLLGDGSYDYRDLTGSHDALIPPMMIATPYGAFASDSRYGKVAGDGLPRVFVGRFPVTTDAQFTVLLNKIRSYETTSVGSLQALLLADQPDAAGDFIANRNAIQSLLTGRYDCTALDPGYSPAVTSAIALQIQTKVQTALNGGVDLFSYIGHGAEDQLGIFPYVQVSSQSPVQVSPTISNSGRLPILVAMTCVAGNFAEPGFNTLGESLLRNDSTGVVAAVAATGLSQDSDAKAMNQSLMRLVAGNTSGRLGDLLSQAFSVYASNPPINAQTPLWIYNILGDPALQLVNTTH